MCERAAKFFSVVVGRMHDAAIGPHMRGSCQLAFAPEIFGTLLPWLIVNRCGLTVFVHAETGDDLWDHTEHVIWLGPSEDLDLARLAKSTTA